MKDFTGEGRIAIKYSSDFINTNFNPLTRVGGVLALLQHDAMLRAERQDSAGAMESCRSVLVGARSIGDEPCLYAANVRRVGRVVAVATLQRVLAQGEPLPAALQSMQELLAREIDAPILLQALRGERGGLDEWSMELDRGNVKISVIMGERANSWDAWFLDAMPAVLVHSRAKNLRLFTEAVAAAKLPSEQQKAAFGEVENKARSSPSATASPLMSWLPLVSEHVLRSQANLLCAMVGVAAERYRIRHEHWPQAIADLVADGLLKEDLRDPYDGQPLRYRVVPGGVVIYSVGADGVDNGGAINRKEVNNPGTDEGFQLWDVRARRQSPP